MQQTDGIQLTLSLKMSPESSQATKEKTSESSLKSSSRSANRQPRCLRLKKDGLTQTLSWVTDGQLLTELWTYNIGDAPRDAVDCTLSAILQENVPEKYYLSVKACEGILRRADKRGKKLPDVLKEALLQQIDRQK